jgi:hypothetical protein
LIVTDNPLAVSCCTLAFNQLIKRESSAIECNTAAFNDIAGNDFNNIYSHAKNSFPGLAFSRHIYLSRQGILRYDSLLPRSSLKAAIQPKAAATNTSINFPGALKGIILNSLSISLCIADATFI